MVNQSMNSPCLVMKVRVERANLPPKVPERYGGKIEDKFVESESCSESTGADSGISWSHDGSVKTQYQNPQKIRALANQLARASQLHI